MKNSTILKMACLLVLLLGLDQTRAMEGIAGLGRAVVYVPKKVAKVARKAKNKIKDTRRARRGRRITE
jgi:hypothetical protein